MKLAILLHGLEKDKPILKEIMDKLQDQLNHIDSDDVETLFCIDQGESTIEEKKAWLLEQTEAKKYVFITAETEIPDNFIILRFNATKGGKTTEQLSELGVYTKM